MVYNFIVSGAVPLFKRNQKVFLNSQMSTAAFPSPTAEMAEMNRIQYELEYTEGISQRMRIPEMLKVAPQPHGDTSAENQAIIHSVIMQVPERIVVAGHSNDPQFPRPRDLDLIQSTPLDTLSLKTPPRVLTLSERPLDFLEEEHRQSPYNSELRPKVRQQRERSISENAAVHNSQLIRDDSIATRSPLATVHPNPPLTVAEECSLYSASGVLSFLQSTTRWAYQQVLEVLDESPRSKSSLKGGSTASSNPLHESRLALSTFDASLDVGSDDMTLVDATALRRQLIKLNRRLQHLEEENKERAKRDMMLYSATIAFWLINTWVWLRR
ncbi:mitochondrial fission factor homolog B isoform X2 [Thalassophryne amazonica]|uniref:mitochondrial fission factor homolog B isoform X2 n=1 Tax=Thalassophryne amazonica TaxID=390379 RepID=UPI001471B70D|nr:mitochondrial fission factor homolog B isoform X2 [Thalassophryne amazonica]